MYGRVLTFIYRRFDDDHGWKPVGHNKQHRFTGHSRTSWNNRRKQPWKWRSGKHNQTEKFICTFRFVCWHLYIYIYTYMCYSRSMFPFSCFSKKEKKQQHHFFLYFSIWNLKLNKNSQTHTHTISGYLFFYYLI